MLWWLTFRLNLNGRGIISPTDIWTCPWGSFQKHLTKGRLTLNINSTFSWAGMQRQIKRRKQPDNRRSCLCLLAAVTVSPATSRAYQCVLSVMRVSSQTVGLNTSTLFWVFFLSILSQQWVLKRPTRPKLPPLTTRALTTSPASVSCWINDCHRKAAGKSSTE